MSKFTPQQLKEAYLKLPEDVKKLYSSDEVTNKLYAIGQKHNLHVDKIGGLIDEVGLVMVGLVPIAQLMKGVSNRLQTDDQTTKAIISDINQEIFLKIREGLKQSETLPPTATIFEQKVGKIFSLPKEPENGAPIKPWENDPYLERP